MEGMIGEIRLFAGNFAPKNWAFCAGQIIAISQNTALFSILGTTYGGNGQTTFALPNLCGRTAAGVGQGPGLSPWALGQTEGTETTTLISSQMPMHTHTMACNNTAGSGTANSPAGGYPAAGPVDRTSGQPVNTRFAPTANAMMNPAMVAPTGNNFPYNNMQPSLALNYIICMYGIFPSRN